MWLEESKMRLEVELKDMKMYLDAEGKVSSLYQLARFLLTRHIIN